jgi:hypothetical protein
VNELGTLLTEVAAEDRLLQALTLCLHVM